ncbi:MAG: hypothetical protein Q4F57_09130 [Weeksellaceae bacterium]|nr:hypothetical protein [Weeksellaceae bacterium]
MIRTLSHDQIDFERYDKCLSQSPERRMYASSFYLNIVAQNSWEVLVWEDYKAVMPLPFRKKLGLKWISQPAFCQQLGIFGAQVTDDIREEFLQKIAKKPVRGYNLPCTPSLSSWQESIKRRNQILILAENYESIYQSYATSKKKDLKRGKNAGWGTTYIQDIELVLTLLAQEFEGIYTPQKLAVLRSLLQEFQKRKALKIISVQNSDKQDMGFVVLLQDQKRWVQLAQVKDSKLQQNGCMSFAMDAFIKEYSGTDTVLDFEGSSIPGVAKFNAGFGAVEEWYCSIRSRWIPK